MHFNEIKDNKTYDPSLQTETIVQRRRRIEAIKDIQKDYDCSWKEALVIYEDENQL